MNKSAIAGFVVGIIAFVGIAGAYFLADNFKQANEVTERVENPTPPPEAAAPAEPPAADPAPDPPAAAPAAGKTTLMMKRTVADRGAYEAGGTVDVTIQIVQRGNGQVRAMGVVENIPPGWTFDGVVEGDRPDLVPPQGEPREPGKLEFAWFNIPKFPTAYTYRLKAPPNATGALEIKGQALYRLGGPELRTGVVVSPLTDKAS